MYIYIHIYMYMSIYIYSEIYIYVYIYILCLSSVNNCLHVFISFMTSWFSFDNSKRLIAVFSSLVLLRFHLAMLCNCQVFGVLNFVSAIPRAVLLLCMPVSLYFLPLIPVHFAPSFERLLHHIVTHVL